MLGIRTQPLWPFAAGRVSPWRPGRRADRGGSGLDGSPGNYKPSAPPESPNRPRKPFPCTKSRIAAGTRLSPADPAITRGSRPQPLVLLRSRSIPVTADPRSLPGPARRIRPGAGGARVPQVHPRAEPCVPRLGSRASRAPRPPRPARRRTTGRPGSFPSSASPFGNGNPAVPDLAAAGRRGPKCQTRALSSNRHRIRLDIRTNLGSNRWSDAGRVR